MTTPKKVIFTGGGSAGHAVPNLPIMQSLIKQGVNVSYVGTANSPEQEIMTKEMRDIPFHIIQSDKLRRYLDIKNFFIPFNLSKGFIDSINIILREKPDLIFSKGGYVSLPLIMAGKLLGVTVIAHESDTSIGLTNKLALPFLEALCTAMPPELNKIDTPKQVYTGIPLRQEFFSDEYDLNKLRLSIDPIEKVILVFGGSLGAQKINQVVKESLVHLQDYTVVHIVGNGKGFKVNNHDKYYQFDYVSDGMIDLLKRADLVICRAGMTTLFELIALKKRAILVPLSAESSRGDQIENASIMVNRKIFDVIYDQDLTVESLLNKIQAFEAGNEFNVNNIDINFSTELIEKEIMKRL